MEITSFVLGMLTIVAVIMLTVIVVGIVKISKLEKKSHNLYELCASIESDLRREIENSNQEIWRQFEATGRDITMVEKTIMNQIEQTRQQMDRAIDDTHRAMAEISHSDRSYVDSRIDKAVTKGILDDSKQILKG